MSDAVLRRWHRPTLTETASPLALVAVPCARCDRLLAIAEARREWHSGLWRCRDLGRCRDRRRLDGKQGAA